MEDWDVHRSSDGTHLDHGGDSGASGNESDALLDVWRVGILGDGAFELQSVSDFERVDVRTHLPSRINLREIHQRESTANLTRG